MSRASDRTLDGYIFTDREHARQWLSQVCIKRDEVRLEEVAVGPVMCCPRCGGSGVRQDVKLLRKITIEELLR